MAFPAVATLALGWATFTPEGNAAAAPALAALIDRAGHPADCAHPWAAWAAVVRGERDPAAFLACPGALAPHGPRLGALVHLATGPGDAALRRRATRALLLDPTQDDATAAAALLAPGWPGATRATLLTPETLAWASADLAALARQAPLGGLYDRALLLADPDSPDGRELDPVADDLDADERRWLALLPDAPVPTTPPPAPAGVLALVPERARDHVAHEWDALVRFVADAPPTAALPDPATRWRLAALAEAAPLPAVTVHAVLRGEAASPPLAAWVLAELATEAGLTATITRGSAHVDLRVGHESVRISRCGGRHAVPADPGGAPVTLEEAEADARLVQLAASLRAGDLDHADTLAAAAPAVPPALAALARLRREPDLDAADTALRAPALLPLRPPRNRTRRAPPPPPAPPEPPEPLTLPADPAQRALLAWWAAPTAPELARRLAPTPTAGPWESVRRAALARLGEPGALAGATGTRGCEDAAQPWPPDDAGAPGE